MALNTGSFRMPNCLYCGNPLPESGRARLYCCGDCRRLAKNKRLNERYRQNKGFEPYKCLICGKEFQTFKSGPHLYCSDDCRKIAKRKYNGTTGVKRHKCAKPGCTHMTCQEFCYYHRPRKRKRRKKSE